MKKSMIIAIAAAVLTAGTTVCHAQTSQSQQTEQKQEPVYEQDKVEQKAEFTGGMMKQIEFMMQNLKYPKEAEKDGASGTVRVYFIVEKDGTLTDVKVPDSVHKALDAEAIRLVKAMPKWTPAKVKGKAVRSKMVLPVQFRLK
ncbi:MAG: energy transducer TonB [Prevotella sp.]|nr:energy transducer TonB [Prevotella sp.]